MATATENPLLGTNVTNSPQEILQEVRTFLLGATCKVTNQRQRDSLSHSALVLLRNLPTARHAVLEYMANMFDEAVNNYLIEMDVGQGTTDSSGPMTDNFLHDSCSLLHTFIQTNSAAWAPIISTWSLELLGHISSKYSERRGVPHIGSLNELLQHWLTCKPTKLLMEVATECFAQMVAGAPETCVGALLEASVNYSPHFDWVVAHIGSSFPRTIITRVLMCGLNDYCHHGNQGTVDSASKIPKIGSVVGILGHLAAKHGHDIRDALMKLFQDSLQDDSTSSRVTTIPFLLQLASMSSLLLHILATDLVKALTPEVLNRLQVQFQPWIQTYPKEMDSLMSLVVHLVMNTDSGADKCVHFLLTNATNTQDKTTEGQAELSPEVQRICAVLLDRVLSETQGIVFRCGRVDMSLDVPYLGSLSSRLPQLTQDMLNCDGQRCKWLQRLICFIILFKGERQGAETLAYILSHAQTHTQLQQLLSIQQYVEVRLPNVLQGCLQISMDTLQQGVSAHTQLFLGNLHTLTLWERKNSQSLVRCTLKLSLSSHWDSLSALVLHKDSNVALLSLQIINYIGIPPSNSAGNVLKMCGAVMSLFFDTLLVEDQSSVKKMIQACRKCVQELAQRNYAQSILVRYLLEAVIKDDYKQVLGGKFDLSTATEGSRDSHTSLLAENKTHGLALTTLRSHSSVFHAGVIGEGLRNIDRSLQLTQEHITRNRLYVEELLWTCCQDNRAGQIPAQTAGQTTGQAPIQAAGQTTLPKTEGPTRSYKLKISPDLCRCIGNVLVELTTPDVLYNTRFWPEEESLKMTVERDLQVWRVFDNNPVLWQIMLLLAGNTLVMSRCSPVLKSLTAAMMNHFESSRDTRACNSPKQLECVCYIVRCLGKSGLLPSPLGNLSELFPLVSTYEAYLLLLTIWRYMKENPPTEDPGDAARRVCDIRHTEVIRSVIHKNIDITGTVYSRFFSAPQQVVVKKEESMETQ